MVMSISVSGPSLIHLILKMTSGYPEDSLSWALIWFWDQSFGIRKKQVDWILIISLLTEENFFATPLRSHPLLLRGHPQTLSILASGCPPTFLGVSLGELLPWVDSPSPNSERRRSFEALRPLFVVATP